MPEPIKVEGLADLNRSLRKLNADAPKGLRLALNDTADFFVGKIRPRIPRRTGRAAASLVAKSTRTSARVAVGGRRARYYPWLDFGGRTGINRSVDRKFIKEGRYVYPTLKRERPEVEKKLNGALVAVARGAGLDVS